LIFSGFLFNEIHLTDTFYAAPFEFWAKPKTPVFDFNILLDLMKSF